MPPTKREFGATGTWHGKGSGHSDKKGTKGRGSSGKGDRTGKKPKTEWGDHCIQEATNAGSAYKGHLRGAGEREAARGSGLDEPSADEGVPNAPAVADGYQSASGGCGRGRNAPKCAGVIGARRCWCERAGRERSSVRLLGSVEKCCVDANCPRGKAAVRLVDIPS